MSVTAFDADRFSALPLIAILRGQSAGVIEPLVHSLFDGGFRFLEITMNSPGAAAQIRTAIVHARDRMSVGAGTVTTLSELDEAENAGACFIVTPVVVPTVIIECVRRGLPVFPGAFTPSEVHHAHQLGATMVKLFPAHRLGPCLRLQPALLPPQACSTSRKVATISDSKAKKCARCRSSR